MEYYLAMTKKKILPFVATCMSLADIMLSEISQTEREKSCIVLLLCGIQKSQTLRNKVKWQLPGAGVGEIGRYWSKDTNFQL